VGEERRDVAAEDDGVGPLGRGVVEELAVGAAVAVDVGDEDDARHVTFVLCPS
jgi:hypothetical protein